MLYYFESSVAERDGEGKDDHLFTVRASKNFSLAWKLDKVAGRARLGERLMQSGFV